MILDEFASVIFEFDSRDVRRVVDGSDGDRRTLEKKSKRANGGESWPDPCKKIHTRTEGAEIEEEWKKDACPTFQEKQIRRVENLPLP